MIIKVKPTNKSGKKKKKGNSQILFHIKYTSLSLLVTATVFGVVYPQYLYDLTYTFKYHII